MRLWSLKSCSASAASVSPPSPAPASYTGVTLWHSAMAFTASWMRLTTLLRTLGAAAAAVGFLEGVAPPATPLAGCGTTWGDGAAGECLAGIWLA